MGDMIYRIWVVWKYVLATIIILISVILGAWPIFLYGIFDGEIYFIASAMWFLIVGVANQRIQTFIEKILNKLN